MKKEKITDNYGYERIIISFISLMVFIAFTWGCATTSITSIKDPSASTETFHRILVVVPLNDIESRQKAETAFTERLSKYNVEGITSINLLLPTRQYNKEEISKILSANKIDGVLTVILTDAYVKNVYIPQSSTTWGQSNITGNVYATSPNTATLSGTINSSSYTQNFGGFTVGMPRLRYEIRLYSPNGNTVWMSTSLTKGGALTKFETFMNSLAEASIEKLKNDGLLK